MYLKDDERPPVGEGLNRAAEVTLMNVRGPIRIVPVHPDRSSVWTHEQGVHSVGCGERAQCRSLHLEHYDQTPLQIFRCLYSLWARAVLGPDWAASSLAPSVITPLLDQDAGVHHIMTFATRKLR